MDKFQRTDDADSKLIQYRNNLCVPGKDSVAGGNLPYYYYLPVFPPLSTSTGDTRRNNIDRKVLCEYNDYRKFKKFVWIFVDSLAHDQATGIIDSFAMNANSYRILNHGFKFSTAIYTSFFTGKIPTNYAGKPIQSDNLFYQMNRAGMNIHFVGPEFPGVGLLGDSPSRQLYFKRYTIVPDEERLLSRVFGDHLSSPTEDSVYSYLEQLTENGQSSLMLTTNLLDDRIHRKGKFHPPTLALLQDLTNNVPLIKKWLSEHPDYLFIMNSDHGGSPIGGTNEGDLHGAKDGGNEGFIFFHHPDITPSCIDPSANNNHLSQSSRDWLDTVDVAPTFARYFKDVNIPLESLGVVPALTEQSYNKTSQYLDLLANALQIRQLCKLKGFPYSETAFERATSKGTSLVLDINNHQNAIDINTKIAELRQFIINIKEPMVDFKKFPSFYLFIMGILMLVIQVRIKY
eukprot:gene5164-6429_t